MAAVVQLRVLVTAQLDAGAITDMSGEARYTLADGTDPNYQKSGEVDITDLMTPGSKTLVEWKDEILASALAQA